MPFNAPHTLKALKQRVEDLQLTMANRAAEAADASFRMKQEHLDEKDKLLRSYRQDKEALAAEHDSAIAMLKQQMRQSLEAADERYAELEQAYSEVKAKYDARAPRDEDMERIRQVRHRGIRGSDPNSCI